MSWFAEHSQQLPGRLRSIRKVTLRDFGLPRRARAESGTRILSLARSSCTIGFNSKSPRTRARLGSQISTPSGKQAGAVERVPVTLMEGDETNILCDVHKNSQTSPGVDSRNSGKSLQDARSYNECCNPPSGLRAKKRTNRLSRGVPNACVRRATHPVKLASEDLFSKKKRMTSLTNTLVICKSILPESWQHRLNLHRLGDDFAWHSWRASRHPYAPAPQLRVNPVERLFMLLILIELGC